MAELNMTNFLIPYGWALGESGWKDSTDLWLRRLDVILRGSVLDRDLATPPGSPTVGDTYLINATATGAWAGLEDNVTVWDGTAWRSIAPPDGWSLWVEDELLTIRWNGTAWVEYDDRVVTASSAAAVIDFDLALGNHFQVTLTESITTVTFSNVPVTGYKRPITIEFLQDATGSWAVSGWPAAVKWPGGTAPTITTAIGAFDVIEGFTLDGGTTIRLARTMADTK